VSSSSSERIGPSPMIRNRHTGHFSKRCFALWRKSPGFFSIESRAKNPTTKIPYDTFTKTNQELSVLFSSNRRRIAATEVELFGIEPGPLLSQIRKIDSESSPGGITIVLSEGCIYSGQIVKGWVRCMKSKPAELEGQKHVRWRSEKEPQ
jgi:hypothetical protein